ncbi:unnamed protein product [Hermetia illucens]|uniref:ADP-ribosylation factor-like protein 2-binding protein n=1 Tax=Hermetia illucens TaxID=343691 RepID=A0A7R8Z2S4_HERIL|nr:ADP-ribosylation factor-like protein 2-binding protein [Hermetia illucens]CAD7091172.1 unnamed protein product [Hermetia illucens]
MNSQILDDCSLICYDFKPCTDYFDQVIGHIEDIVMEKEFQSLQKSFMDKYCDVFEDTDENKLIYMEIFQDYTQIIEDYIEKQLNERMGSFDMDKFAEDLRLKRPNLDGEIFDLLLSLFDFVMFKEMILDFKAEKEGKFNDVQLGIIVTKLTEFDGSFMK